MEVLEQLKTEDLCNLFEGVFGRISIGLFACSAYMLLDDKYHEVSDPGIIWVPCSLARVSCKLIASPTGSKLPNLALSAHSRCRPAVIPCLLFCICLIFKPI
ncbi:hypothetical protein WN944_023710 [Citrus x changshan-huyou]|uniref:Uncharacterized protein n=1 Tax=Citrus x changshan-huyou TaxID=2935761 RepID=A0AAP0N2Q7_9ROSI